MTPQICNVFTVGRLDYCMNSLPLKFFPACAGGYHCSVITNSFVTIDDINVHK